MRNRIGLIVLGSVVLGSLLVSGVAFAATQRGTDGLGGRRGHAVGMFGTVSAVNGTTVTVTSKGFGANATQTTYTVDATKATVTKNGSASSLANVSVGDTVSVEGTVSGTNVAATAIRDGVGMMGRGIGRAPGVFGTIASVNGTSITVTSKMGPAGSTSTTYTVDATSATVTKNGLASSVSGIVVGDTVMVQGTVNGTSVTATSIRDGMPQGEKGQQKQKSQTPVVQGNGQPVVGGTVTAMNGTSLTLVNKSNVTYTVDASSSTVEKAGAVSSLASVSVGDNLLVQGAVNGTSVTASSIIDGGATATAPTNGTSSIHRGGFGGFMGSIGSFFQHLFGFF